MEGTYCKHKMYLYKYTSLNAKVCTPVKCIILETVMTQGFSDLKSALLQQQFWGLSISVQWGLAPDLLLAISELSSTLSLTISLCF